MEIFNKEKRGSVEIVSVLGIIGADLDYTKWEPFISLAMRDVNSIIGRDVMEEIAGYYKNHTDKDAKLEEILKYAQQSVAFFAWLKITPTLDAQHGTSGRNKKLGENERGLTALQEYKDERNILNLAYESVDALVEALDTGEIDFWKNSKAKKNIDELLIKDKDTFDRYYRIGSHRLYLTLVPIIREVQDGHIVPVITRTRYKKLLENDKDLCQTLMEGVRRPLALLTIKKAVERLPVEVLPDGIVQVQQTGTVREKLRAEKEARKAVAESLQMDVEGYLQDLQDLIAQIEAGKESVDLYISKPLSQSRGITF